MTDKQTDAGSQIQYGSTAGAAAADMGMGQIEQRGIDIIPEEDRHGRPKDLFWIWLAANLSFLYIVLGGVLLSLGLNLWQAILAVLVGNAFYWFIGQCATPGPVAGTSTMMVSRAQYGIRGNHLSTWIWWFNLVAFAAINFSIGTLAAIDLVRLFIGDIGEGGKGLVLATVIAITMVIAVYGYDVLVRFQSALAYALGISSVLLLLFVLPHVDWSYTPSDAPQGAALVGLWFVCVTIIAAGPLSWCGAPADISRYLPSGTSSRAIARYTALGAAVASAFLAIVAVLAGTAVDMSNFTMTMKPLMPFWFYPIFLAAVVIGSICNNSLGIYSSGLTIQTIGIRLRRHVAVIVHGALGTAMAVFALFVSDFIPTLTEYLQFAVWWYAPFIGIMVADIRLRRGRYDGMELHRPHGMYWFSNGINWRGIAALGAGVLAAGLTANTTLWQSPISTEFLGGADISPFTGMLVGGFAYWALMRDLRET